MSCDCILVYIMHQLPMIDGLTYYCILVAIGCAAQYLSI
jgi:hypothetical protein